MEAVKFAELKREQPDPMDHTNEPPSKRQYAGSGARNEMRFLIPSKMAGVIIGKGGANIKRLREEFSAKVSVPDSNGPERVLCLEGEQPMLESLLADVLNTMVVEGNSGRGDRDGLGTQQGAVTNTGDVDLRLLVHQSQAGCIIGKGGSKIKELREESKLRALKVYSVACPVSTDRVIQMIGAPAELLGAVRMVSELLESAPPKGQIAGYDARNFDEFGAEQYGGWPGRWGVGRQDHSVAASAVGMPPGPPGYPPGGALAAAAAAAHMRGGVAPAAAAGSRTRPASWCTHGRWRRRRRDAVRCSARSTRASRSGGDPAGVNPGFTDRLHHGPGRPAHQADQDGIWRRY
ncbi:hypothetical protein BOX15_Mlig028343g6 [Macrostomum lignano]|uniref:K Homology domain-containing protein n=1 Tax=Macrostomum lignano TaxID=282301 RepID=A0A267E0R0_9PLAT|nr:hypothetical protein BOX15_Mlig028343g6 [Macrostomum lignano]